MTPSEVGLCIANQEILAKTATGRRGGFAIICTSVQLCNLIGYCRVFHLEGMVGRLGRLAGQKSKQPLVDSGWWSVNHRCCHGRLEIQ